MREEELRNRVQFSLRIVAAAAVLASLSAVPAGAQEQPVVPPAPPEVRNFQLQPDSGPPPAQPSVEQPTIEVAPQSTTATAPAIDPATAEIAPALATAEPTPAARIPRGRSVRPSTPAPDSSPAAAAATDVSRGAAAAPAPASGPAVLSAPATAPTKDASGSFPWAYAGAGVLALLALFGLLALRRRGALDEETEEPTLATEDAPEPAVPVAAAAPEPRPRLTLEFKPLMAGSTEEQAAVQFELAVRNAGDATARNVRIAMRMVNAGATQDEEIAAFYAAPVATVDHAPLTIPPNGRAETRRTAVLPKDAVRAISFQGKSLFIPVMAFNILYEWGEGRQGQTATSFVIGRETNPPTEKMAPFRLDLGPRIYRTVGHRRNELELVA